MLCCSHTRHHTHRPPPPRPNPPHRPSSTRASSSPRAAARRPRRRPPTAPAAPPTRRAAARSRPARRRRPRGRSARTSQCCRAARRSATSRCWLWATASRTGGGDATGGAQAACGARAAPAAAAGSLGRGVPRAPTLRPLTLPGLPPHQNPPRLFEFAWKGQLRVLHPTVQGYQGVLADVSTYTGAPALRCGGRAGGRAGGPAAAMDGRWRAARSPRPCLQTSRPTKPTVLPAL
jgi:hypothetical protein